MFPITGITILVKHSIDRRRKLLAVFTIIGKTTKRKNEINPKFREFVAFQKSIRPLCPWPYGR